MSSSYGIKVTDRQLSWAEWTWALPGRMFETTCNTFNAMKCQGLLSLFRPCYWRGRDVSICHLPGQTYHIVTSGKLVQEVLQDYPGPGDKYHSKPAEEVWMPILHELFGDEFKPDDFLLICRDPEKISSYRTRLGKVMTKKNRAKIIDSCIQLCPKLDGEVNMTKYIRTYTTRVMAELIGYSGDWTACSKISEAVDQINRFAMRRELMKHQSDEEKEAYSRAISTMQEAVEEAQKSDKKDTLVALLQQEGYEDMQVKGMLFLAFFAGSETSALLLSSLVWHLGSNHKWQDDLSMNPERFSQYVCEALRYCPPVPFIGRHPNQDMELRAGQETYLVPRGGNILTSPFFAARDPRKYTRPDEFDPNREKISEMSWCPFSAGKRMCPGKVLAMEEAEAFIKFLLANYVFVSTEKEHPPMEGYLTMKLEKPVIVTIIAKSEIEEVVEHVALAGPFH